MVHSQLTQKRSTPQQNIIHNLNICDYEGVFLSNMALRDKTKPFQNH